MSNANDFVKSIKQAAVDAVNATKPVEICFGEVTSASPLKINVEQKMTLSSKQLILTRNVTDYEVEMDVNHETEPGGGDSTPMSIPYSGTTEKNDNEDVEKHTHDYSGTISLEIEVPEHTHAYTGTKKFVVHNALQAGESVILVRQQEGQKYIVLDRVAK